MGILKIKRATRSAGIALEVEGSRQYHSKFLGSMLLVLVSTGYALAKEPNSRAELANFRAENVEITKASAITAGTTEAIPWNQTRTAPLPAYCRVEGDMNRRTGVDGEEFGITFALAMLDE